MFTVQRKVKGRKRASSARPNARRASAARSTRRSRAPLPATARRALTASISPASSTRASSNPAATACGARRQTRRATTAPFSTARSRSCVARVARFSCDRRLLRRETHASSTVSACIATAGRPARLGALCRGRRDDLRSPTRATAPPSTQSQPSPCPPRKAFPPAFPAVEDRPRVTARPSTLSGLRESRFRAGRTPLAPRSTLEQLRPWTALPTHPLGARPRSADRAARDLALRARPAADRRHHDSLISSSSAEIRAFSSTSSGSLASAAASSESAARVRRSFAASISEYRIASDRLNPLFSSIRNARAVSPSRRTEIECPAAMG